MIMKNNFEMLQDQVMDCSSSKDWNKAILEWDIIDFAEDSSMEASCKCGKEHIKYLYTISNKVTGSVLEPIGSSCIQKFGRQDMKEQTNIYEQLFRLVNARRDGKFIELKSDDKYFSNKLLDYLLEQKAINIVRHETLKKFFNQRKPLTYKQKKFATWIVVNEIFPFLDKKIEKKVKHKSNVVEFKAKTEETEISKLIQMRQDGKFITEDIFNTKLVEELNKENVFSSFEYNNKKYNNYETMLSLISKDYTLTVKQRKLYSSILMRDIMPYLDSQIKNKAKAK